jgi:hypothetical protein
MYTIHTIEEYDVLMGMSGDKQTSMDQRGRTDETGQME